MLKVCKQISHAKALRSISICSCVARVVDGGVDVRPLKCEEKNTRLRDSSGIEEFFIMHFKKEKELMSCVKLNSRTSLTRNKPDLLHYADLRLEAKIVGF